MAPKRPLLAKTPPSPPSSAEEDEEGSPSPPPKQKPAAKKSKSEPVPPPPAASDEEGSSSEAAESGDEEEEEEEETTPSKYTVQPTKKPLPEPAPQEAESDDSSSGSESESESDGPPPKSVAASLDPSVKPITSKPMDGKVTSKAPKASPAPATASKRSAEASVSDEEPPKKLPFQRLWTEESEVRILEKALEFIQEGRDPATDMASFYESVQKSIDVACTKSQCSDKLRRLKKKYENNLKRAKKGKDPEFAKPLDKTKYDLSKQIWNSNKKASPWEDGDFRSNGNEKSARASRSARKEISGLSSPEAVRLGGNPSTVELRNRLLGVYSVLGLNLSEDLVKKGVDLIDPSTAQELEEKWQGYKLAELELYLKRTEFQKEFLKTVTEALKNSDS